MDLQNNCNNLILTRSIFLRGIGFIYLLAFCSIYLQIQGLYGDEGISPVKELLNNIKSRQKETSFLFYPNLLIFSEKINRYLILFLHNYKETLFSPEENVLHLICLLGILISLLITINNRFTVNMVGFFICWLSYLTITLSGQLFLSFQWDVFLLEAGFLAIMFAPIRSSNLNRITSIDIVAYYLLRFLMFRFIYSSGVVKITSNCPEWSKLTALHHHFQSQPLPNIISYFAHNLFDDLTKKVLVAIHFVIEIYTPFLFFNFLSRRLTIFSGILQIILQISIILTGNYNFFNLLTIVVNFSNFDDDFLSTVIPSSILKLLDIDPRNPEEKKSKSSLFYEIFIFNLLCLTMLIISFIYIFPLAKIQEETFKIYKKDINFFLNNDNMNYYLSLIYLFIFSKFLLHNIDFFNKEVFDYIKYSVEISIINKLSLFLRFVYSLTCKFLFTIFFFIYIANATSVFYQSLNLKVDNPYIKTSFSISNKIFQNYHINSGYGLFRVMTGVGGRPELEIKYMNRKKQWKNIDFKYKISHKLNRWPIFNIPHQPRIDWQIWFSALRSEINSETWLVILTGKIFEKNPIILDLLGYYVEEKSRYYQLSFFEKFIDLIQGHNKTKFTDSIDMIKIEKYHYHFTNYNTLKKTGDIWKKTHQNDFLMPTDIKIFKTFFETLDRPFKKRSIKFSFFQQIPVIDYVVSIIGIWIFLRIIFIK